MRLGLGKIVEIQALIIYNKRKAFHEGEQIKRSFYENQITL